jgi:hypothetical protein
MSYLKFYHIYSVILSISNCAYKIFKNLLNLCQVKKALRIEQYSIRGAFGEVENLRG